MIAEMLVEWDEGDSFTELKYKFDTSLSYFQK